MSLATHENQLEIEAELRLKKSLNLPQIIEASKAISEGRLSDAEAILRQFLTTTDAYDPVAIQMLADIGIRLEYYVNAEQLLRKAIELMPSWLEARYSLAIAIYKQNRISEALHIINTLIEVRPENIAFHIIKAEILVNTGEYYDAIKEYELILSLDANLSKMWMCYAHNLKTIGQIDDAILGYKKALTISPELGEVWWSLANLKTYTFSLDDVQAMKSALSKEDLSVEDRSQLEFALGKAAEDQKDFPSAMQHYSAGNDARFKQLFYDREAMDAHVDMSIQIFTKDFFAERLGEGCSAKDPIFIVGMHRAGSTLIEQILASHPDVEGTFELNDMPALVKQWTAPPARVDKLTGEGLTFIGQQYLERTKIQRKLGRIHFIDKFPSNWQHVPFIHMVLPNAVIIDARRHPMACCFSNYKQYYALGHAPSYDLSSMGHHYSNYVRLMRHVDEVLPGRVHRVIHEDMVDNPEREIRKLLDACNLSFDPACLKFHENKRAVRTPSAEQVRRPIYRESTEAWQHFEPWLGKLKDEIGDLAETYRI